LFVLARLDTQLRLKGGSHSKIRSTYKYLHTHTQRLIALHQPKAVKTKSLSWDTFRSRRGCARWRGCGGWARRSRHGTAAAAPRPASATTPPCIQGQEGSTRKEQHSHDIIEVQIVEGTESKATIMKCMTIFTHTYNRQSAFRAGSPVEALALGAPAEERQRGAVADDGVPDEGPGRHEQQLVPQRDLQGGGERNAESDRQKIKQQTRKKQRYLHCRKRAEKDEELQFTSRYLLASSSRCTV